MNVFPSKSLAAVIIASFLYGLQGVFMRLIGISLGIFYPFIIRGLIISSILFIFLYHVKTYKKIASNDYKWFILMPLSGIVSFITIFIAYNHLAIGTVLFVFYASFVISGFLSGAFIFKEKVSITKIASLIISLIGLALIFSAPILQTETFYLLLSLISGITSSLWFIISKKIPSYPFSQILAIDSVIAFIACLIISVLLKEKLLFLNLSIQWLSVLGLTTVSFGAYLLSIYGFRLLQSQIVSLLLLLEVVFGIFLAWVFFSELPNFQTLLGGAIILIGAALPNLPFLSLQKNYTQLN